MKFPTLFSPSQIGLDIQPHGVRLIQLKKINRGFVIERIAAVSLPNDIFFEGKIRNWDSLSQVLGGFVRELGIKGMTAVINLPANLVRMQHLHLPYGLSDEAIEAEIDAQMQRDLPGMTEALNIDFNIVRQPDSNYIKVFFAVARQAYLLQYVQCVATAGLCVKIADVDIYALQRLIAITLLPEGWKKTINAILHTAGEKATLIVFNAEEIVYHSQWEFIDIIALSVQLKNRIQVCRTTLGNIQIHQLILCVMQQYQQQLMAMIDPLFALEVSTGDPFTSLRFGPADNDTMITESSPDFLVACGLAMREGPRW